MSYATGSATDRNDLLGKLRDFAVLNGWTVNRHAASGTGFVLNLQKAGSTGTLYANLRSVNNEDLAGSTPTTTGIVLSMSDGYDAARDAVNQPGGPVSTVSSTDYYATRIATINGGVPAYWLFGYSNPDLIACVIQLPSGEFQHLLFGEMTKTDVFTGGAIFHGSCGMASPAPGSHYWRLPFEFIDEYLRSNVGTSWLRASVDGRNGWWTEYSNQSLAYTPTGYIAGAKFLDACLIANSLNTFNNLTVLVPVHLHARLSSGRYRPLGYLPYIRTCKITNFVPSQTYTLGSEDWKLFPALAQANGYGIAYRYLP